MPINSKLIDPGSTPLPITSCTEPENTGCIRHGNNCPEKGGNHMEIRSRGIHRESPAGRKCSRRSGRQNERGDRIEVIISGGRTD